MNKSALYLLLAILVLCGFIISGESDYVAEMKRRHHACEMHAIWLSDAFARVPMDQRRGWPISAKDFKEKCED